MPQTDYKKLDEMSAESSKSTGTSRARSVAVVGLSIAIIAVCTWVTIPMGPIPFTLQMFAIPLIVCILRPSESIAAIAGYLVLGAVGLPLFSGMRGGIGVIMGPTGGFLLGYLPGVILAALFLYITMPVADKYCAKRMEQAQADQLRPSAWQRIRANLLGCTFQLVAGIIFTFVSYVTGWAQFMLVASVGPEAAFAACVAPFILLDAIKLIAAVVVAQPIRLAISR
ncbi:biotin transporter BioY [Adlercreutzia sp. ZJ154]|uniref:biotin transporter BioY n=1 Tax=Adlercreutzia sp. ZJ154 TaxID=2709790 RepID=UPI001F151EF5|nr:biotin transporter BioY [Adlercreutzia sp. ZJ154]